ncbi:hypothetical protein GCM10009646_84130 [Streptomyces aureus]
MGGSYQQEVDLLSLYKDVASDRCEMVTVPEQLPNVIDRAMRTAYAKRTVTAVIIPADVQELDHSPPTHAIKMVPSSFGLGSYAPVPDPAEIERGGGAEGGGGRRDPHRAGRTGRAGQGRKGRPSSLPLEDRVLLVAANWQTNLILRQLGPLFGVSKSAADRIIDHLGPTLALQQRKRFRKDTVLIVDGTLVPTRDHSIAEQSKNHRYSTNHQVVIDADTRLVVAVGRPLPCNRNDCKAWDLPGAKDAVGKTTVIADGGYRGTDLVIPHRREPARENLRHGKRNTTPPTARSAPASSTPSPG